MWIFLQDAMLSVVDERAHQAVRKGAKMATRMPLYQRSPTLLVRARFKGDIERTFPNAKVTETVASDYRYRASIPREEVALVIDGAIRGIDYGNFKAGVAPGIRHSAYFGAWAAMEGGQQRAHGKRGGGGPDFFNDELEGR
ncbi:MAG TPA: hypothetical protein VI229_00130 [Burkholderiales bacterium]